MQQKHMAKTIETMGVAKKRKGKNRGAKIRNVNLDHGVMRSNYATLELIFQSFHRVIANLVIAARWAMTLGNI